MEAADIQLPKEEAAADKQDNKRYLLGGPPFPVDSEVFKKETRRDNRELTPTELALVSDSDVKIIEPEDEAMDDGPTNPDPKKKKKKPKKEKKQ
jgi:hypothetical protein